MDTTGLHACEEAEVSSQQRIRQNQGSLRRYYRQPRDQQPFQQEGTTEPRLGQTQPLALLTQVSHTALGCVGIEADWWNSTSLATDQQ